LQRLAGGGDERRAVDGFEVDRLLVDLREGVDAGQFLAPAGDAPLALGPGRRAVPGDRAGGQVRRHPAGRLDRLECLPRPDGKLIGQAFDIPASARRIADPGEVALLGQDHLGVAGDTPGEAVGQPVRMAVGQHGEAVGPAHRTSEGGDGGAQHVDP